MSKQKSVLFELTSRGNAFVLEDERGNKIRAPRTYILPKRSTAKNPKTQRNERIQYFDTASSIWASEQLKNGDLELFDKDERGNPIISFTQREIKFKDGFLSVDVGNTTKLEYVRHLSGNEANGGNVFRERDLAKEARVAAQGKLERSKGVTAVMNLTGEKLLYAYIAYFPENTNHDPNIMRAQLIDVAEVYADDGELNVFIESLDSTETYEIYRTVQMFRMDILELGGNGQLVKWKGGGVLTEIPIGIDPYEHTANWFLTNEKGRIAHKLAIKKHAEKINDIEGVKDAMNALQSSAMSYNSWTGKDIFERMKTYKILKKHGRHAWKVGKDGVTFQVDIATTRDFISELNDRASDIRNSCIDALEKFKD